MIGRVLDELDVEVIPDFFSFAGAASMKVSMPVKVVWIVLIVTPPG